MARIAFDIDERTKQEIKIRLAGEGRTLSEVMRTFCSHYKNFGLHPGQQISWEERNTLPETPGIYFIYAEKRLQYIGQTTSLMQRLTKFHHRKRQFAKMNASIFWIEASTDILAELEEWFIDTLKPPLNGSEVPINRVVMYPCTIRIKAPEALVTAVKRAADAEYTTVSSYIRQVLIKELELVGNNDDLPQDD